MKEEGRRAYYLLASSTIDLPYTVYHRPTIYRHRYVREGRKEWDTRAVDHESRI